MNKGATLEKPECELGYPEDQLQRILGEKYEEFRKWMRGQTMGVCDGRFYNYDTKEYQPTFCGPHGPVVYSWDVAVYLDGGAPLD